MGYVHEGHGSIICHRTLAQKEKQTINTIAAWFKSGLRVVFTDTEGKTRIDMSFAGHIYDKAKTIADLESLTAAMDRDGITAMYGELALYGRGETMRFLLQEGQWIEPATSRP